MPQLSSDYKGFALGGSQNPQADVPDTPADAASKMPNGDKLLPYERSIYNVLPGFSQSGFGKALEAFNGTLPGKALQYLDVFAEGTERSIGTAIQLLGNPNDQLDLKAAWYAGSLTYDTSHLPNLLYAKDGKTVTGIRINMDLPGASAGLTSARQSIEQYVAQGMSYTDALKKARDEYYNGLGALALRGQLQDAFGHALLDPTTLILGELKPVDFLKKTASSALAGERVAYGAEDLARLSKVAKEAGDLESAAHLATIAEKVASGEVKQINTIDKIAIFLTGGNVFEPTKLEQTLEKAPLLKGFILSPESKASEAVTTVGNNVATNIIARFYNTPNFEEDAVRAIQRASMGAIGPEFGHSLLSPQGRGIQALLAGDAAYATDLLGSYQAVEKERGLLGILSVAMKDGPTSLLTKLKEDPGAVLKTLLRSADPEVAARLQSGELTADVLKSLAEKLDGVPLNKEMFSAALMDRVETHAMQQAVLMFGVKERGALTRWSDAIKKAESLAFMRLNPAYPIRNFVNNELTMMARGVFNTMGEGEIDAFWKLAGFTPPRLSESFHLGSVSKLEKGAGTVLDEATKAARPGAAEGFGKFFQDISLGKLDTSTWARSMERSASRRAFTSGYRQFMHEFWKPTRIENYMKSSVADAIKAAHPDVFDKVNNAIRSSLGSETKLDQILSSNLHMSVDAIIEEAEKATGTKMADSLGTETLSYLHDNLPQAIQDGKLSEFRFNLQRRIDDHIDQLFDSHVQDIKEQIVNQVKVGGPQAWHEQLGRASMMWLDGEIEHSLKIGPATDAAKAAVASGDYRVANSMWAKVFDDEATHFARYEKRMNAMYDGLEQGWKELKADAKTRGVEFDLPDIKDVRKTFTETRNAWSEFFDSRTKGLRDFFQAKLNKGEYKVKWDELQRQFDEHYQSVMSKEKTLAARSDQAVADMIRDPAQRKAYLNYRGRISQMRDQLRKDVQELRKTLTDAAPGDRQQLYTDFWSDRQQKLHNMRLVEQVGTGVAQNDPQAVELMLQQAIQSAAPGVSPMSPEQAAGAGQADLFSQDVVDQVGQINTTGYIPPMGGTYSNNMERLMTRPVAEFPEPVRKLYREAADSLLRDLQDGEPGKRLAIPPSAESTTNDYQFIRQPSTNPDWYKQLYTQFNWRKPDIEKAIQKIMTGKGRETSKTEYLRRIIMERLLNGDPTKGEPPNLYAMHMLGGDNEALIAGLMDFRQTSGAEEYSLLEAISASGMPDDELAHFIEKIKADDIIDPTEVEQLMSASTSADGMAQQGLPFDQAIMQIKKRLAGAEEPLPAISDQFVADVKQLAPDVMPLDLITEQANYGRVQPALDAIIGAAKTQADKTPLAIKDLPANLQAEVMKAIKQAKGDFSTAKLSATKFAEFRRDSALLNYNRRTNFDNWIAHVFPYIFWTTGSMQAWALESLQRPAMLTNYLRSRKFLETAGQPNAITPSRFKDSLRIKLPFAPDWMGSQFVDPMRMLLPFDAFMQPFEQWQQKQQTSDGRAERLLDQQLSSGQISRDEYNQAVNHTGPAWDHAVSLVQQNDEGMKFDAYDFASLVGSPHLPLQWGYLAATGQSQDIGPATPMTRIMRNAFTTLGVEDWNNSQYNVEAKIRKQMGLPAYDKWDDYRIDRELSNLSTTGNYALEDIKHAMALSSQVQNGEITSDQAKQESPIYEEAIKRANQEYTGGGPLAFGLSLLGINVKSFPEGEQALRGEAGQFSDAYARYKSANDKITAFAQSHPNLSKDEIIAAVTKIDPSLTKDSAALTEFFDAHPEYETRLALFDKPEERLRKFTVDNLWARWFDLPTVTRRELAQQLGQNFNDSFLNKQTRSYDNLNLDEMTVWLKLMGGTTPGLLTASQENLADLFGGQLKLTKPETAWRAQVFYDTRSQRFPDALDEQTMWYDKAQKGTMTQAQIRDLKTYWDWRRDFMGKNPDIVPYITEVQTAIDKAKKTTRNPDIALPQASEIPLSYSMQALLQQYHQGGELPYAVKEQVALLASRYQVPIRDMYGILGVQQP